MAEPVISVAGLRKSYGGLEAVRGVDLEISRGEIFAFLGPNGAGKTTTVEILEGFRERSAGEVSVLGVDPARVDRAWRQRVGFVLQECRLTPELTVSEAVAQYAGYYSAPRDVAETVALVGLSEKAGERTARLSGGQQRRLDVALALIGDPELLFLDEPTTGFDPSARRHAWKVIANLRDLGKTVFLTTHYMDEAQALADRAAIIVRGEVVAEGSPEKLGGEGVTTISFRLPPGAEPHELPPSVRATARLNGAAGGEAGAGAEVSIEADDPLPPLRELTEWAAGRGFGLPGLEVRKPSLEDVYLRLTEDEGEEV
ncbi:MAG: ABC transporter ATP-binding protein [Solirubrobacterales bacterium]